MIKLCRHLLLNHFSFTDLNGVKVPKMRECLKCGNWWTLEDTDKGPRWKKSTADICNSIRQHDLPN